MLRAMLQAFDRSLSLRLTKQSNKDSQRELHGQIRKIVKIETRRLLRNRLFWSHLVNPSI